MMAEIRRLGVSVEALAALGADLRLLQDGDGSGDPQVRALLRDAVRAIDPRWLDCIDTQQAALALAFVQTVFRQALDLLDNPVRAPGWRYRDPAVLQAQGQLSRQVARGIDALASQRPKLSAMLLRPGAVLDVGTGVGWLAIELARAWPALRVVGLDPWEPALALARQNVGVSGLADRIELRTQRVEELDEAGAFALAWLPGPFIGREIACSALARVQRALVPGGWLIFGLNPAPADPVEQALESLRTARGGGHAWTLEEVAERLLAFDFEQIEVFSPALPIRFIVAQRS